MSKEAKGITFKPEQADVIYRWLKIQDDQIRNPSIGVSIQIPNTIGLMATRNRPGVIDGFQVSVQYDHSDLSYRLGMVVAIKDEGSDSDSGYAGPSGLIRIPVLKPRQNDTLNLDRLEKELKSQVGNGCSTRRGSQEGVLKVDYDQDGVKDEYCLHPQKPQMPQIPEGLLAQILPGVSITQVMESPPGLDMYQFHTEDVQVGTLEEFSNTYKKFGFIAGRLLTALHRVKGVGVKDEELELSPAKALEPQLDTAEKTLKQGRMMLGIDGDEAMIEEVRRKVILSERPTITFEDIGGCEDAKRELLTVVDVLKDPEIYRKWGTYAPKGVLLEGLPGTGKTLLAKALANRADAAFFHVKIADILHSLYGRTERLIQTVFDEAEKNAPVVVFFDEIDAITAHRDQSTEVTSRIVTVLLTNMDGLEERDNGVIVVGATNRLSAMDSALLRPGRFNLIVNVPLPEQTERAQIFEIHMNQAVNRADGRMLFGEQIDIKQLIDRTEKFSGADIEEVIRRTLTQKVRQESAGEKPGPVTVGDLLETVAKYEKVRIAKQKARMGFDTSK